ncbi:MAG TPA: VOC family protein [Ktedonobacterales bacterium]
MTIGIPRSIPVKANIAPWLAVRDGHRAVAYYQAAFGAVELYRLEDDEGRVMVAQFVVGGADFWVQEDPDSSPGGGVPPIRMILTVDEPEVVFQQALAAGAREIAPVSEGNGWLIGRLVDPFGHQWEVGKPLGNVP